MIKTDTKMTMKHFHDFYYLQAIHAGIMDQISRNPDMQFSRAVEKLQLDLQEAMDEIVPNMALRTFVYLYAACLGEARHAAPCAKRLFFPSTHNKHRGELFGVVTDYAPTRQNLDALVKIFDQDWSGSFGGKQWLNIAKALYLYQTVTPAAFIDHVVDLEHNTGTAFSKPDSYETIEFDVRHPDFEQFLNYKFRYDILTKSYKTLEVTRRVYNLVKRYCTIFGVKIPYWVEPGLAKLTDYVIQWGDKTLEPAEKWREWINVGKGNKPNARQLLAMSRLDEVYPPNLTQKELKRKIKRAKAIAKESAGQFLTPYLTKQLNKKFNKWLEYALKICKIEKVKTTYKVLPFKVCEVGENLKFQFALPYQGIGTETDFGFELLVEKPYFPHIEEAEGYATLYHHTITLHINDNYINVSNNKMEALLE